MTFNPLDPKVLASLLHVCAGAMIFFAAAFLFPTLFLYVMAAFYIGFAMKEMFYDTRREPNNPFLWAGVEDIGEYFLGTVGAVGVTAIVMYWPLVWLH